MFWFKKKKEEDAAQGAAAGADQSSEESGEDNSNKSSMSGNAEIEFTKIKSQLEALNEVRKANAEQFTRISEQVGELRGALMDSNKAISVIEVASTKAIDMVNSVQPDKLMIEVRKTDGKVEALRANIEANEAIMKDILRELKEMRAQMNFYKGVDQVVKMNNEIKQELIDIKKSEGLIGKHADRVETIFVEVEKKFYDFEKFNEAVKELDRAFKRISSDFDKMRVTIEEKADKKEFVKLVDKFSDFEKHTSNILKLLDQRSKNMTSSLNDSFNQLKSQIEKKYSTKLNVAPITEEKIAPKPEVTPDSKMMDSKSGSNMEKREAADTNTSNAASNAAPNIADAKSDVKSETGAENKTENKPENKTENTIENKTENVAGTKAESAVENKNGSKTDSGSNTGSKGLFGFLKK
ncbi:MAG: hypothetical protein ACP5NV_03700 [Candidatus Woesearchaeota archaeon]